MYQEIIEAIEIYNAFIEGKGYIFDSVIDARLDTKNASRYDDEAFEFWKKVKELEDILGVVFDQIHFPGKWYIRLLLHSFHILIKRH